MNMVQNPMPPSTRSKKPFWKQKWFWITIGVVLVIGLIGNLLGSGDEGASSAEPTEPGDASEQKDPVSESVAVPDVIGQSGDVAKAELEALGLAVQFDAGDSSVWEPANWDVEASDPEPGATLEEGDTVTLVVNRDRVEAEQQAEQEARDELATDLFETINAAKGNSPILTPITAITHEGGYIAVSYQGAVESKDDAEAIVRAIFGHSAPHELFPEGERVTVEVWSPVSQSAFNIRLTSQGAWADFS